MIKKWDVIIIVFLAAFSLVPELIFGVVLKKNYNDTYAQVTIEGKVYKNIPLSTHKGSETFEIKSKYGINIITVKDNKIAITDADCPDKVCVKSGYAENPGDSLICLPHKLMIEIKGKSSDDDVILSY